ncbi:MAG: glycosyltransferase [Candidatus Aminicenantes bacterium]|nr:glycosyltransferase [Candidatus Aminicenantes bacterium]
MSQQENIKNGSAAGPRVLILPSWWYPNRNAPFSGLFVRRQAEAIAAFCPTAVLFVTPDPFQRTRREIVSTVENGLPTVRVYFRPASASPWGVLYNSLHFMAAAAAGRRALPVPFQNPDLIHVQITPPVGLILFLRFFWRQASLVFSEHWSKYLLPRRWENPLRKWFIKRFIARCASVTTVSKALARGLQAHGLKAPRWQIIGNPVNPDVFFPPAGKTCKNGQLTTILHVSFLTEIKKADGIVRAMAILARRRPNVRLLVVGDGPTRPQCEKLARDLGLFDDVIFFLGTLPEADVAATMRQSDILVLFSEIETFGCVAAEALASGLAVVSTPTAVAEFLPLESGILVPFGDEQALASALEKMVDLRPAFDSSRGCRVVRERFAPMEIGRRFYNLFQEVVTETKA